MKKFYCSLLFCIATAIPIRGFAQEKTNAPTGQMFSLEQLVSEALEHNPELNFYRLEISAAKGDRKSAGTWSNPDAEMQLGRKRATEKGGLSGEGTTWSVSVSQSFEYPGRLALRKAIANRQIELAELGYAQFRAALAAKVRGLGYSLLTAQEKAQAAQEVARRGEELIQVLVQRDPAGVTPLLETRIIEATIITLKRHASEATKIAQTTLFELNQLRGQSLSSPLAIAPTTLEFPPFATVEDLLSIAATNNFELRMRQIELAQQGFKVELSKNERWPTIKVAPFYSQERAADTEKSFGVGVSIPLPIWNRNNGNIQTAHAREEQAATALLLAQREVERELREHYLIYETRREDMAQWRRNAIDELREASALGDRNYRLGALPISTYIELQEKYLDATEAILDTQKEALEAKQKIELLIGSASQKSINERKP